MSRVQTWQDFLTRASEEQNGYLHTFCPNADLANFVYQGKVNILYHNLAFLHVCLVYLNYVTRQE